MISRPRLKLLLLLSLWFFSPLVLKGQDLVVDSSTDDAAASGGGSAAGKAELPDFNNQIYYRNKLEFSLETGVLPINLPFVFDVFVGGDYSQNPLHYTLVPIFPSLRWHTGRLSGPSFLRGNTDITATLSLTAIPRGPEKIYGAFDLGFRRNFVHRNWRVAPYFEGRCGAGFIDAQGPHGHPLAQGEDYTFTIMTGTGFRYNFDPKWSMEIGATYMHVSNLYLSEPRYTDNGINVVGPIIGFNRRLGRPKQN